MRSWMLGLTLATLSAAAIAQMPAQPYNPSMQRGLDKIMNMNPATIQAAMGMGACVQKHIGLATMQRLAQEGEAFEKEMIALCDAGKRDEAEDLQARFAARMKRSGNYQKLDACYSQFEAHLQDPALDAMHRRVRSFEDPNNLHVCDS